MSVTIVGNNTPTAGGVVYGDGTNYASTAAGTSGQVLTSNGSGAPTWAAAVSGAASVTRTTKSANYTLAAGDKGNLLEATSGTFTFSVTAAATLGSGWWCYVSNAGTGYVTIDPNASETVTVNGNALTTWVLWPNEMGILICDGSNFFYYQIQKGFITQTVGAAVASVSFATGLTYRPQMQLAISNLAVNTSTASVDLTINGASQTSGSGVLLNNTTVQAFGANSNSITNLFGTINGLPANGTGANKGRATIFISPSGAETIVNATHMNGYPTGSYEYGTWEMYFAATQTNISSITFTASTGNITVGTFVLMEL